MPRRQHLHPSLAGGRARIDMSPGSRPSPRPGSTAKSEPTALVRLPLLLARAVEHLGVDPREVALRAGIPESLLQHPDARIPQSSVIEAWRILGDLAPGEAVGLRAAALRDPTELGLVGYMMRYSPTPLDALMLFARYVRIVAEAVELTVDADEARVTVRIKVHPAAEALRHSVDCSLAIVVNLVRLLTGRPIAPLEVRFPYPHPADVSDYRRMFRATLFFGRHETMVVFRRCDMDLPARAPAGTLVGYLEKLAKTVYQSRESGKSFLQRIRWAIWADLSSGRASSRRTAKRLGVSVATLGRRLRDEGTNYSTALDSVRHELAVELIRNTQLGCADIAFLLGYSAEPSFRRAFRRWEGISPRHLPCRRRPPARTPSATCPTTD